MFAHIDRSMNGTTIGSVASNDIDKFEHFSSRKTLSQLHDELMSIIEERVSLKNTNIL